MAHIPDKTARFEGKDKIISYYEDLLEKHGDSHRTLDWNSKDSQELRYVVLLGILIHAKKNKDFSLLDAGCGIGHMLDYLKKHQLSGDLGIKYTGIDLSKKLIDFARAKNPDADFRQVDLLEDVFREKYDFVLGSGLFNIRMADLDSHKECVLRTFTRMFDLAKVGMAVNFICRDIIYDVPDGPEFQRYVYFTPEEVIGYCRALTGSYILRHDYHQGDFTVYLFK